METTTEMAPETGFKSLRESLPTSPLSKPATAFTASETVEERRIRLTSWRADPYFGGCPVCKDLCDTDENGEVLPCHRCNARAEIAQPPRETEHDFAKRAHIPLRFEACRVHTWEPADGHARRGVTEFCTSWPPAKPALLMTGDRGRGKTHLAAGALYEVFGRHNIRGRFWPVVDLLDRYRATFDQDRATESVEAIDAEMRRTPLLVLDDMGAHKSSEWAEERLFRLVDERYRNRSPLIVTTNLSLMELPERVRSRLGEGVVIQFRGADRRLQGAS